MHHTSIIIHENGKGLNSCANFLQKRKSIREIIFIQVYQMLIHSSPCWMYFWPYVFEYHILATFENQVNTCSTSTKMTLYALYCEVCSSGFSFQPKLKIKVSLNSLLGRVNPLVTNVPHLIETSQLILLFKSIDWFLYDRENRSLMS